MTELKKLLPLSLFFVLTAAFTGVSSFRDEPGEKEITKSDIMKHITYLASDELAGRFPGTEGDVLTRNYISEEFEKYKLMPAGDNGFVQSFEMYTHVRLSGNNSLNIVVSGDDKKYEVEKDFTPYGFSGSGIVSGEIAFVGYGISTPDGKYDDYKDKNGNALDVSGKILLMMRYSPGGSDPHSNPFEQFESSRFKAMKAKELNAAGVILFNGPNAGEEDKLARMTFDNVLKDVGLPVISCRREAIVRILEANGLDIKTIQEGIDNSKTPNSILLKNASAELETNVEPVKVITDNIVGFLEGTDPILKKEVIVIGAHKDHLGFGHYGSLYSGTDKQIHNGADDNASGTSGMLEIAQKLSAEKKNLKRSYLFLAFGGEEAGLLGSSYFTNSDIFKERNVVAMLNMDMIGRLADDKLIVYGTGTSPFWSNSLDSLNSNYNFKMTFSEEGGGRSDHASFYNKDIPVLHFFTGTHKDYHSPSDDIELINQEGAAKVTSMVYDVAVALDGLSTKPEFTKIVVQSNEGKSMGSVKVYVGTIPDYSYSGSGMKISGVKEGGPADKGGLKAEDIIIKFGENEVKDIYGYMYAMGGYKPGDEVVVIVKRNNEEIALNVTLGSR